MFFLAGGAPAQDRPAPLDVLNLDVSASAEVVPDLAVVVLAVQREGQETAALTQDVEQQVARALAEAKTQPVVQAVPGGYSTSARYDNHGNRLGWQLRATVTLRSRDFAAIGRLAGKLTAQPDGLQIAETGFDVSPELRDSEESGLVERAIAQFKTRATQACKALGYGNYAIREVSIGQAQGAGGPRPLMARVAATGFSSAAAPALPLGPDHVTLTLDVHGSVLMRH